jgi:CRISPR-associated endonuclease/helicase Cas3
MKGLEYVNNIKSDFFDNINIVNLKEIVINLEQVYAHSHYLKEKETLEEHLDLTLKYCKDIILDKKFDKVFEKIYDNLFEENIEYFDLYKELIVNAVYLHDIGKVNLNFQKKKMDNDFFCSKNINNIEDANHSLSSAIFYINYFIRKLRSSGIKGNNARLLSHLIFVNGYCIAKHHSSISTFGDFIENLSIFIDDFQDKKSDVYSLLSEVAIDNLFEAENFGKFLGSMYENLDKYFNNDMEMDIFIYTRILFALITASDFYATSQYMDDTNIDISRKIEDIDKYFNEYKSKDFYKYMQAHKQYLEGIGDKVYNDDDINRLRSEMGIESEKILLDNMDKNVFYLEAPTGSGKTITSVNLALNILKYDKSINRLFYIFPFNTLAEQTNNTLINDLFKNIENIKDDIAMLNCITPFKIAKQHTKKNSDYNIDIDYQHVLLDRQFLHYPFILTTNIALFRYLFGTSREDVFPIFQLANSVIILDEIQSYKSKIWKEMIIMLNKYAKLLNIKFIIMSATLPCLDKLVDEDGICVYLIENREKYYNNPLFKDRVNIDYSLLEKNIDLETLNKKILNEYEKSYNKNERTNKILIECIKKRTAIELYKMLKDNVDNGNNVFLLTGDDNKAERTKVIEKVKNIDECILVATQVIEAGVDIDMDIGFKDISLLDSEEQFLGRINRSCKKNGCITFFYNLDDANNLYKGEIRRQLALPNPEPRNTLKNKEFNCFYKKIIHEIDKSRAENIEKIFNPSIKFLDFKDIERYMKLIDDNSTFTIFLNITIEFNGEELKGENIWNEYKELYENKDLCYAEKKVKLSELMEKVNLFTYTIYELPEGYSDTCGYLYYYENGEKYLYDGKFNRDAYSKEAKSGYSFI